MKTRTPLDDFPAATLRGLRGIRKLPGARPTKIVLGAGSASAANMRAGVWEPSDDAGVWKWTSDVIPRIDSSQDV